MNVSNGGTHPSQIELVLAGGQTGHILYAGAVASADLQESTEEKTDGSHGLTLDMHAYVQSISQNNRCYATISFHNSNKKKLTLL